MDIRTCEYLLALNKNYANSMSLLEKLAETLSLSTDCLEQERLRLEESCARMNAEILSALREVELQRAAELSQKRQALIDKKTSEEGGENGVLHRWMTGVMQ